MQRFIPRLLPQWTIEGVITISKKNKRTESKPFTLTYFLKRGGKKIGKKSIDFFPRNDDEKHVKKTIESKISEILEKEV